MYASRVTGNYGFIMGESGDNSGRLQRQVALKATKLQRVLPIAESCAITEGELTITSIELYEDGSIVRSFVVASDARRQEADALNEQVARLMEQGKLDELEAFLREHNSAPADDWPTLPGQNIYLRLEDDLGTIYGSMPRGGGGGEDHFETSYGFTPAIAPTATLLRIHLFEGEVQPDRILVTPRDPENLIASFEVPL